MCARFVQVGNQAINLDLVELVEIEADDKVTLYFPANGNHIKFEGENAERFLAWWYNRAGVYKA